MTVKKRITQGGSLSRIANVSRMTIQQLLRLLGVEFKRRESWKPNGGRRFRRAHAASGSFWLRMAPNLLELLEQAGQAWRKLIVHLHPDRGGDPIQAATVNAAWQRIQKLFKQHGVTLA